MLQGSSGFYNASPVPVSLYQGRPMFVHVLAPCELVWHKGITHLERSNGKSPIPINTTRSSNHVFIIYGSPRLRSSTRLNGSPPRLKSSPVGHRWYERCFVKTRQVVHNYLKTLTSDDPDYCNVIKSDDGLLEWKLYRRYGTTQWVMNEHLASLEDSNNELFCKIIAAIIVDR